MTSEIDVNRRGTSTRKLAIAALLVVVAAAAQTSFEVASIKPNNSGDGNSSMDNKDGSLIMRNYSLRMIIEDAYHVKKFNVLAPDWVDLQHFDIRAKVSEKVQYEQIRVMLQSLLADRFALKVHRESKGMPAYALLVAKGGFKLKPAEGNDTSILGSAGAGKLKGTFKHVSMSGLADYLSGRLDRPVVDATGIPGSYDFTLEWSPEQNTDDAGASLFTVLTEQLGLRLETRRAPVSILVVDHINRFPTEN